jgi:hypothetical protein
LKIGAPACRGGDRSLPGGARVAAVWCAGGDIAVLPLFDGLQ